MDGVFFYFSYLSFLIPSPVRANGFTGTGSSMEGDTLYGPNDLGMPGGILAVSSTSDVYPIDLMLHPFFYTPFCCGLNSAGTCHIIQQVKSFGV